MDYLEDPAIDDQDTRSREDAASGLIRALAEAGLVGLLSWDYIALVIDVLDDPLARVPPVIRATLHGPDATTEFVENYLWEHDMIRPLPLQVKPRDTTFSCRPRRSSSQIAADIVMRNLEYA